MTTELVELAGCPFCGGKPCVYRDHSRDCSFTWIGCSACLMQTAKQAWMGSDSIHVERMSTAWNTRSLASRAGGWDGVAGECVECGTDPETGAIRIIISTTMEALRDGPPLVYRNVTVYLAAAPEPGAVGSNNSTNDEESV